MKHLVCAVWALLFVVAAAVGQTSAELSAAEAALEIAPLSCGSAPLLSCGSSVTASPSCLSDQYYLDLYTINGTAGQTITLTATTTTSYQMLVTVQSSSGPVLASRYGSSPVTLTYTFPSTATYYIGFGYVSTFATGSYTLRVSCGSSSGGQCQSSGTIPLNGSVSGQLTASNGTACLGGSTYSAVYGFNGTKDVPVNVTFTSSFAPYVEVETDNAETGIWKQSNTAGTVTLTYVPVQSGQQWIYFMSKGSTPVSGTYTIRLDAVPADPCRRRAVSH